MSRPRPEFDVSHRGIKGTTDPEAKPDLIVAGYWPATVNGSIRAKCSECGAYVSLGPDSGQLMIIKFPLVPVVCYDCAVKRA